MSTLLDLSSRAIPPGTYNYGPFAIAAGQSVTALLTPSTWPASGQVLQVALSFADGQGGGGLWTGGATPKLKGGAAGIEIGIRRDAETSVTAQVIVSQAFTASLVVTSP